MVNETPTPLGALLIAHRKRLGLSQKELSKRTETLARDDPTVGAVSVRTIVSLERPRRGAGEGRRPRRDTAHSLAIALGMAAGSPGYREFMAAARQDDADTAPPPATSIGGPAAGFVDAGREEPLLRLASGIDAAMGSTPVALLVRGEHGAGRTAIIEHALRQALERHPRAVALWGAAGDAGDAPHAPFRRIVRLMLGDVDGVADWQTISPSNRRAIASRAGTAARAIVEEGPLLAAIALSPADGAQQHVERLEDRAIADRLMALASSTRDDAMWTIAVREQFYRVLARYAATGPVILVIEDLDRTDPSTLASISQLLDRLGGRRRLPVAVILSCLPAEQVDPEIPELRQALEEVQRLHPHGTIDLTGTMAGPAARAFAEAMLRRAAIPPDPAAVAALVARTDGNPHYISQLVDAIGGEPASGHDVIDRIETTIPASLVSAFGASVGRLPPELRQVIASASVLGVELDAETLMQMLDLTPERFLALVDDQLWRRYRLLLGAGTARVGARVVHRYRFHPPLLRDAVYRELSDLERTHAHGRAADALIELHGIDDHDRLGQIADHLDRAGRRAEAARVYLRAGEHARARRDFDRARHFLERIADLRLRREDPETWIHGQIGLGLCLRGSGDPAGARPHLTRALDLATSWPDKTVMAKALEALGMLDFDTGHLERGYERILRAIEIWAAHDAADTGRALANLSYILYGLGHYDEAIANAERARIEATRTRQERWWIDGTIALANCWIDLGRYDRAAELYEHAQLVGGDLGDIHRQRLCWANLALAAIERGDWDAAETRNERVMAANAPVSDHMAGVVAFQRGLIAEGRGNLAVARDHYRRARELRERNGQEALVIDAIAGELRIATAEANRGQAASLMADLERRLDERGAEGVEHPGRLYVTLIEAALALDRTERGRQHARDAIALLTERTPHVPEADRECYLGAVPSHRRLLELAAALGAVAG